MKPSGKSGEQLDGIFAALSDSKRRAILVRLAKGEATVNELAGPFAISQPAVSKHLRVLEAAGLIVRNRDAQRRPSRLNAVSLRDAAAWLTGFRALWKSADEDHGDGAANPKKVRKKGKKHKHKKH